LTLSGGISLHSEDSTIAQAAEEIQCFGRLGQESVRRPSLFFDVIAVHVPMSLYAGARKDRQAAFVTAPERRQRLQTLIFLTPPLNTARTF